MNPLEHQLQYPFGDTLPAPGSTMELAPGLRWIRMPLPFALDHINLWLLRDCIEGQQGWTIIDCGISGDEVKTLWIGGEQWPLSMQEMGELNAHNEDFTVVDPIEERLAAAFNWSEFGLGNDLWVTATDSLMKIGVRDPSKGQTITAGRVLKKLNGGQRKKTNGRVVFLVPADEPEFSG